MADVICLDDSSDEEEAPAKRSASVRSGSSSGVSNRGTNNNVVELLDDSGDEEVVLSSNSRKQKSCSTGKRASNSRKQKSCSTGKRAERKKSTDDDEWSKHQMEAAKRASLASVRSDSAKASRKVNRVSLCQSPQINCDSDSDSDESLPYLKGPTFKKKLFQGGENLPILSKDSRMSLSQSSESSNQAKCGVNPYVKKTPARAPSKASGVSATPTSIPPMKNPYKSSQNKTPSSVPPIKPKENPYLPSKKKAQNPPTPSATASTVPRIYGNNNPSLFATGNFPYPTLLNESIKYPDLRARFLLAFWKSARGMTQKSYEHPKLDQTVKKIVALALWPYPLRSLEEFCLRPKTAGSSLKQDEHQIKDLREQLDEAGFNRIQVPVGANQSSGYCSVSEACLVAMATEIDRRRTSQTISLLRNELTAKEMWITLGDLIPEIDKRLHPHCCPGKLFRAKDTDGGVAYYTSQSTRSAEYRQIEKLKLTCTTHIKDIQKEENNGHEGYIKQHKYKKQVCFELTPLGYQTAKWIQTRVFPAPPGCYRTSKIASLRHVRAEHKDICLAVDFREGGFKKPVLQKMCNKLDMKGMPYFVGTLDIGDYAFFWTKPGPDQGKLCPILVERKSIQDLAQSLVDGRYERQKRRMYHGQHVFGHDTCRIAFLIEGKEEKQLVSHGFVGHRKFGVTHPRLVEAIEGLEAEGFDVLRSTSPENSCIELAKWATRVAEEVRTGKLKVQYTFAEFKAEVRKIPEQVDFSRIAKDFMQRRKEKERQHVAQSAKASTESGKEQRNQPAAELTTVPNAKIASRKPAACDSIDLCSDYDDDDDQTQKTNRAAKSKSVGKPKPSKSKSPNASLSNKATQQSSFPRFKPSSEVEAWFAGGDTDEESDDDIAAAIRTLKQLKKGDEERRKRKGKEAAKCRHKKRKSVAEATGGSKAAKKQKKSSSKGDAISDSKRKQSASPDTDKSKVKQACGDYEDWTSAQLKAKCAEYGLPTTGKKTELIEKLKGPKPPRVWLERKNKGEYVPARYDTGATALLVALYLHEREVGADAPGMTKDDLYSRAEELEISKNPFSGGTTQTGPYHYDGWSSMSKMLSGDPALIIQKKHSLYKLTRGGGSLAGYPVAEAIHRWCHEHNNCQCGGTVD